MRLSLPFLASLALLAVGLVGGVAFDPVPPRPRVVRGGYRVLEADLHAHTSLSDGTLSPPALVRQARRRAIDVLAVTEHNGVLAAKLARAYARALGESAPLVLVGEEITTARFHLVAIGLEDTVAPAGSPEEIVEAVHAQGGLAVAAHPVARFWPVLVPLRARLDGAEVLHPLALAARTTPGWRAEDLRAYFDGAEPRVAAIGSSDYHAGSVLGLCRTLVFVEEPVDAERVLQALRARRTVVVMPDGELVGDPASIEALGREPYRPRTSDHAYVGEGAVDRITRTLGWLGAVGLVLFRARPRRTSSLRERHARAEADHDESAAAHRGART